MKSIKLIAAGIMLLLTTATQAQVSVNVNIGTPPPWGPVGYANIDFYYIPDIQAYYDIRYSQFIYFGNGRWIRSRYLPPHYRNYDLYRGYKVVLTDYHGRTPYVYYKDHKTKYYKGYKGHPQKSIGNRSYYKHDNRKGNNYYKNDNRKGNDHYKHGKGNSQGNDRGQGHGNKH